MAPVPSAPATGAALEVREISHAFGEHVVLDRISFAVSPGELVAVIGPNGAGKTTMLRIAGGALVPDAGEVSRLASEVGWVPQQPAVYGKLTARENLVLFAGLEGVGDVEATVDRMLDRAGLVDRADDELSTLSGGNQQRVNIAVGVLASPGVLLLDEPSSSLDPRQRGRMWEFVGELTDAGTAVLFTTHDVAEAERHADRVLVLLDSHVAFDLPPAELHVRAREIAGDPGADFETAFVALLDDHERRAGHG
jgi:ABC-2 type transport system ATP-binding protein